MASSRSAPATDDTGRQKMHFAFPSVIFFLGRGKFRRSGYCGFYFGVAVLFCRVCTHVHLDGPTAAARLSIRAPSQKKIDQGGRGARRAGERGGNQGDWRSGAWAGATLLYGTKTPHTQNTHNSNKPRLKTQLLHMHSLLHRTLHVCAGSKSN